jgi:hypothetical protein
MPTRRRVLTWAAATAAWGASALARAAAPPGSAEAPSSADAARSEATSAAGHARDEETARLLKELVLRRALESSDAWLEMHVVLALGADVGNQRGDVLDQAVAQTLALSPAGFRKVPHFPLAIERHPFHFLQVMQATGVSMERAFATPHGRFTHREILEGSEALLVPADLTDELSWVVSVLTHAFPPEEDRFVNARGDTIVVRDLVERHLRETEAAYTDTFAAMDGKGLYKRGVLHTKACNGTHLLYGLIDALGRGYGGEGFKERVERLAKATLFRLKVEPLLIDKSLPGDHPMARLNADAAKFTFFGHAIEDLGLAYSRRLLEFSAAALRTIDQVRAELQPLTERLGSQHDLDALSSEVPSAYRIILGDACHALRGIRMWL